MRGAMTLPDYSDLSEQTVDFMRVSNKRLARELHLNLQQ